MNIQQFALTLEKAATDTQAEKLLSNYLSTFNIQSYAFTYYLGHVKTGQKLRYHCVSSALQPWHQHYLEEGYANVDRTLHEYYNSSLPCFWDIKAQLKLAKNKRELRMRNESIEFGLDKGLSIPIYGPSQDFASLTLHQKINETCLQQYLVHQFEWIVAAQLYYSHIKRILQLNHKSLLSPLTKREAQCLSYTAKAWRVEQIAKELKICISTVNFHIQNANKKLGVHNKYLAAYQYLDFV